MAKSNGLKVITSVVTGVVVVFGLVYFLHAQQQADITEVRKDTHQVQIEVAEMKGDIKYLVRILETEFKESAESVNNDTVRIEYSTDSL